MQNARFNPRAAYIINSIDRTVLSPAMKFPAVACAIWENLGLHWLAVAFALAAGLQRIPIHHSPKISMAPTLASLGIRSLHISTAAVPVEHTAAKELALLTGAKISLAARPGAGVNVALASRGWVKKLPAAARDQRGWMWLRIADGAGEITADEPALLFAAVRLLVNGLSDTARAQLERGLFIAASFGWHRPHWDGCNTQYWRSARGFDPEQYAATLAESGFTHCEVNGLQAHMPYEDLVTDEYYPQFYTYAPGFNHFLSTPLTRGLWPEMYLEANLNHLKKLADIGRRYGLRPGVCMFEPRSMPERLFQKYPTLRGARIDHPFRSRLPRYTLAQDHPISVEHYRAAIGQLLSAVPDLSYMSVWTNDSGAGFEHTASLYVGRNGGPYMIREWRNHDKVAAAAGASIARFLKNLQSAAAAVNPDFDVLLRIEPFKVEHEHIKAALGGHVGWEAPSLMVKGYHVPYNHPRYPEQAGVGGSIFQSTMDPGEAEALMQTRAQGVEPVLYYSPGPVMNQEPLLGIPFPRALHQKLLAVRDTGITRISAFGGLANTTATPYWPNPQAIRAAQFFPDTPIDDILLTYAQRHVGAKHAPALVTAWDAFEEAVSWQPTVPLFTAFGFCWQRTWDRPIVPDIAAIAANDRAYYEKHGCFQFNNPSLFDLGKDVLFDLISREHGTNSTRYFDRNVFPRLDKLIARLAQLIAATVATPQAQAVFIDLYDRARAYRYWCGSLRSVCAWCADVYGYLAATKATERTRHEKSLQTTIDLELANTAALHELLTTTKTEVTAVSAVSNNTFFYGEDLPELLLTKIRLMKKYRNRKPHIPADTMWLPAPGTTWPKFN
jgi:hypothetical protein